MPQVTEMYAERYIGGKVNAELVERIDRQARREQRKRAGMLRVLLSEALNARESAAA